MEHSSQSSVWKGLVERQSEVENELQLIETILNKKAKRNEFR